MTDTVHATMPRTQPKLPTQFKNIPIIVSLYHLYSSFHDVLVVFPKSERYGLGATCQTELLQMTKYCLRAAATSDTCDKARCLKEASVNLDTTRLLLSLCRDCRCMPNQTYQQLDSRISEIGRMLGGWLKSISSSP